MQPSVPLQCRSFYDFRFTIPNISFVKSKGVFWPSTLTNLPSDYKAVYARRCCLKLASKIFASVRLVLTCVDKALHGFTSDFHVLVLKWISVVCVRFLYCCLFVIAVLIVNSIIHRCSEYINRTVTVQAITSTSSAYAVENSKIIKEQKRRLSEIKFKGREKLK